MATIATTAPVVLASDGTTSSDGALRYADWRDRRLGVPVRTRVVHGPAASVLAAAARAADLRIVRRTHEHRPFEHLGATVRGLLPASPTPVEVVPGHCGSNPEPEPVLEKSGGLEQ